MKKAFRMALPFAFVLANVLACGKPQPVSPAKPAIATTTNIAAPTSALLLSWKPDEVRALREKMAKALVVVSFDGRSLEVLPQCSAEGEYTLMEFDAKTFTIELTSANEVRLNAPPSKSASAADRLKATLLLTGRTTATRALVERKMLTGDCARATHFVHHADTGVEVPAKGPAPTCPEDGFPDDHPCAAPFRVHLHPFGAVPPWDIVRSTAPLYCPEKAFVLDHKCVASRPSEAFACNLGDVEECAAQCEKGNASSCNTLAWMIVRSTNESDKIMVALNLFARACKAGHVHACANTVLASAGHHVDMTNREAGELYVASCRRGDAEACLWFGEMFNDTPEAQETAKVFFTQACLGGFAEACGRRAMHMEIDPKEIAFARAYHGRACNDGYVPSCVRLGAMLINGTGGPVDVMAAKKYLEAACNKDNADGCANLGLVYHSADAALQDYQKAAEQFDKGCQGGAAFGCRMLANMEEHALGRPRDMAKAAGLYAKGCSLGAADSCLELGRLHLSGEGILKDERRAVELFEQACKHGEVVGCHNLAILLDAGTGAPKDTKRARELHEQACKAGYSRSCRMLAPAKP